MPRSPSIVVLVQFVGLRHLKAGQWPTTPTLRGCDVLFGADACSSNQDARDARRGFGGVRAARGQQVGLLRGL